MVSVPGAVRVHVAFTPDETAYLCRKEGLYYYHYQGGPKKLDMWMGPYRIDRKRVKPDEK